jgi:hypothetical protein
MLTRLRCVSPGKTPPMRKSKRRTAGIFAAALASTAIGGFVSPAVSHADCAPGTEWWDPVANICRPTGAAMKNCLPTGWWDPTINDCRPF